ncbi:MAG: Sau3AI family type II restriction endonuclease [Sphaerochaetaceae bacterium]|nr:Sau3AI family type II restriction endonuclease [Sphaerochaetaceae bacterium]
MQNKKGFYPHYEINQYFYTLRGKSIKEILNDNVFASVLSSNSKELLYGNSIYTELDSNLVSEMHAFDNSCYKIENNYFGNQKFNLKLIPYFKRNKNFIVINDNINISIIDYSKIVIQDFKNSFFPNKIRNMLLLFYNPQSKNVKLLDNKVDFICTLDLQESDIDNFERDFNTIKQKVLKGKAHELTEADTLYLCAEIMSKYSTKLVNQPNSNILAKPRSLSLKSTYLTYLITKNKFNLKKSETIISDHNTIKNLKIDVLNQIYKYQNEKDKDLFKQFFTIKEIKGKDKYSRVTRKILQSHHNFLEEFKKANIIVKTLRINATNQIVESVSFPAFKIQDLIKQEWEYSDIYNFFLKTIFLFVLFKERNGNYYLDGAEFWNMPINDINNSLKEEWLRAQNIFKNGVSFSFNNDNSCIRNNLPAKSDTKILHVRPHANKSAYLINGIKYGNGELFKDTDVLPNGNHMTKQSFWLNNNYVLNQIQCISYDNN